MGQTLSYFVIYVAEALIAWQYFTAVLLSKYRKSINFLTITFGYLLLFLVSFKETYWLNTLAFFFINFLCIRFLFEADGKKALFHSLVLTVAMNVTELLMMNALTFVFKDFSIYVKDLSLFVLLAVTSKILYCFVLQVSIRLLGNRKDTSAESKIMVVLLCAIPVGSIWIAVTLIVIGFEGYIPDQLNWFVSIGAVLMLFLNICVVFIYNLSQQDSEKYLQAQLQLQKESADAKYYKMLLTQDENQKILIHDIKKHMYTISDLLDNNLNLDAKEYIDRIIQSKELSEKLYFCDNSTLNLLLVRYKELCEKHAIQFFADIRKNTVSFLSIEDIASLFGNLLENAIEAATEIKDAYIELSVKYNENQHLMISMINSCNWAPELNSSGDYISRKKDKRKHGLGMKSIRKIAKKYNGTLHSFYNEEDQTFHTMITF
mgnify:FL=1